MFGHGTGTNRYDEFSPKWKVEGDCCMEVKLARFLEGRSAVVTNGDVLSAGENSDKKPLECFARQGDAPVIQLLSPKGLAKALAAFAPGNRKSRPPRA